MLYSAAQMDGHVSKPVRVENLLEIVKKVSGLAAKNGSGKPGDDYIVDWDAALAGLGGNEALASKVAALFLETVPSLIGRIRAAVEATDSEALLMATHSFRSSLGIFGARRALESLQALEQLGRGGEVAEAGALYSTLDAEVERLRAALANRLKA